MTLVEVSLTVLILAIVMLMAFDFLDRASLVAVKTDSHARAEDDAQRALRTATQHLRGAQPIVGTCGTTSGTSFASSYADCVRFEVPRAADAASTCGKSTFVLGLIDHPDPSAPADEKALKLVRTEQTTSCTTGAGMEQVLLLRVVNGNQPLFTYYAHDGTVIHPTAGAASVPTAATVKATVSVRYRNGSNPVVHSSAAALRNNISR